MPLPRARRPPRPPPPTVQALLIAEIRRRQAAWRDAVHTESWRLVYADGLRGAGAAEFARGEQSLRDQGLAPPQWLLDWEAPATPLDPFEAFETLLAIPGFSR